MTASDVLARQHARLRVLNVDDDPASRALTAALLKESRLELGAMRAVGTAAEAHEELSREPADVVLVDFRLGSDDGLALCRELLQKEPDRVVLLLTADEDPDLELRAAEAGVADLIPRRGLDAATFRRAIRYARQRRADRLAAATKRQRERLVLQSLPNTIIALYDHELRVVEVEGIPLDDPDGHSDASVRGAPLSDFLPPAAYARFEPVMLAALRGEHAALDLQNDGREFHVDIAPLREADRVIGVLTVWRDVTERTRIEQERRDADRLFRTAFDHAPIGMVMVDLDGRLLRVNAAISAITGYDAETLADLDPFAFVHPEDRDSVQASFEAVGQSSDTVFFEHRIVTADDRVAWVNAQATLMRDDAGAPRYVLSQVSDVTERMTAQQALDDEHAFTAAVLDTAATLVIVTDREGSITRFNAACETLTGLQASDVLGRPFWEHLLTDDETEQVRRAFGLLTAGDFPSSHTNHWRTADGTLRLIEFNNTALLDQHGNVEYVIGTGVDITDRHEAEQNLRSSEARFASAFAEAPIGMALVSLDGRFMKVNEALCDIVGYDRARLEGMSFQAITHPDDVVGDVEGLRALQAGLAPVYRAEKRYLHASGRPVWISLSAIAIRDQDGVPTHMLSQMVDITERRRFEARLQHMADHDPLTGLVNRRRFETELASHVARCERYGPEGALMVVDLDQFKAVNDTLGHNAGDSLIITVAGILREHLRTTDVLARLGGDEFAILLPQVDRDATAIVAAKLVEAIREQGAVVSPARRHHVTASVGVLMFGSSENLTAEEAIVDADLAMYDAKEAGRDRFCFFADENHRQARTKSRLTWMHRITDAIDHDGFMLEAQPILNLRTDRVTQYELLVRMLGDSGDLIPPATFLYIAERFGSVSQIDRWVVGQAIEALSTTARIPVPPILEVNVSGHSIGDDALVSTIERELANAPEVDPARLVFEITETAAIADVHHARTFAERLGDLGCRFALNDFGAGFGSLYYLKHLPFDYLKIDGEFVAGCANNRTDQLVIDAAVGLAGGLGKQTIAEFVGDDTSLRLLRSLGVDYAQGYLIGRPRPLAHLLEEQVA